MRNAQLLAVLACVLPMTGCITLSLYPLYTAKDVVTDLPLEGKWMDSDKKEVWEIRRAGDAYVATDPTDEKSEPIEVRLVRLGERHFLDFTSNQTPSLAIAAHLFSKVWMTGDELHIQTVDDDWLAKKARDSGLAFAELPDKDVLVTAPTADLQKLVLRYADDASAFKEAVTLHRVTPPAQSPAP
ncbi:MAG: hypothetical protein ABSH46_21360 [Bryobacteraceae bacterium]|jgi:hypothetical protein